MTTNDERLAMHLLPESEISFVTYSRAMGYVAELEDENASLRARLAGGPDLLNTKIIAGLQAEAASLRAQLAEANSMNDHVAQDIIVSLRAQLAEANEQVAHYLDKHNIFLCIERIKTAEAERDALHTELTTLKARLEEQRNNIGIMVESATDSILRDNERLRAELTTLREALKTVRGMLPVHRTRHDARVPETQRCRMICTCYGYDNYRHCKEPVRWMGLDGKGQAHYACDYHIAALWHEVPVTQSGEFESRASEMKGVEG